MLVLTVESDGKLPLANTELILCLDNTLKNLSQCLRLLQNLLEVSLLVADLAVRACLRCCGGSVLHPSLDVFY